MNSKLILEQLNLSTTKETRNHVLQLIDIAKFLQSIKSEIISHTITESEILIGRRTELHHWRADERYVICEGEKRASQVFEVRTKTGYYKQNVPINCDIHREINSIFFTDNSVKEGFAFTPEILQLIKKCGKITSYKWIYRDAFKYTRLTSKENKLTIKASDGHRLILKTVDFVAPDFDIFMHYEKINFLKPDSLINITEKGYSLNGLFVENEEIDFPDYSSVWPEYTGCIEVNRNELIEAIKQTKITANKVTKRIDFHLNGSVQITGFDLDYNHSKELHINYSKKTLPDFDISFNADFLIDGLTMEKPSKKGLTDKVILQHSGESNKGALLIDGAYLLMPVCLPKE